MARASGPKPRSVERKRREGNPGKERLPDPVLVGGRSLPTVPDGLAPEVERIFGELLGLVADSGLLDRADAPVIEQAASALARARAASREIAQHGVLVEVERSADRGRVFTARVANPALAIERDAWRTFEGAAEQLGLGPAHRARLANLGVEGRRPEDEIAGLAEVRALRAVRNDS